VVFPTEVCSCRLAVISNWRHLGNVEPPGQGTPKVKELLRTNNAVYLSFAEAVLKDAGIQVLVFDSNMSVMEGSIGVLPRRLMVPNEDFNRARKLLDEAEPPNFDSQPE
jgi:hypothetical protein